MKRMLLIPAMFGLTCYLWCSAAGAVETRETVRKLPNGSVETCRYETDFITVDGANIIRTAWRCVITKKVGK
jgi:hypothetical protein